MLEVEADDGVRAHAEACELPDFWRNRIARVTSGMLASGNEGRAQVAKDPQPDPTLELAGA